MGSKRVPEFAAPHITLPMDEYQEYFSAAFNKRPAPFQVVSSQAQQKPTPKAPYPKSQIYRLPPAVAYLYQRRRLNITAKS